MYDSLRLTILLPVCNDWPAAKTLLGQIDAALVDANLTARVLLVDDGSVEPPSDDFAARDWLAFEQVRILELRRNVGHQRAIVLGLAYLNQRGDCDAVVVMDADGEDLPGDVPRLVDQFEAAGRRAIVFAERRRRTESLTFRLFYWLYRQLHLVLTGLRVRVGNFCIMPAAAVASLVAVPETWNHVAAAVFKSRLPYETMPTARGYRLAGRSSMNFVALVVHGLSALSVFGEIVGVRLMVASVGLFLSVAGLGVGMAVWSLGTRQPIPGWAAAAGGLVAVLLTQLVVVSFLAALSILSARNAQNFLPLRDWRYFVRKARTLFARPAQPVAKSIMRAA
jgi:polyisoprenyl-phosphate glycosyltransferase